MNSNGGPGILVNTTRPGNQNEPSVVALADGGFLVTWEDDAAGLVRGQRYDATGNRIGLEFVVKEGLGADSPDTALLSDGRVVYALAT